MRRRQFGLGLLALPALARRAGATEQSVVRLAWRRVLSDLPLMVMQRNRLIEHHAAKLGLRPLQTVWPIANSGGGMIGDLLGNQADFGVLAAPELADLWDHTRGMPGTVRALSSVALQPFMLVTRDPAVKSLRDFSTADTIAVPRVKLSTQAVCLEMAAAKRWGLEQYSRLNRLTLRVPDAQAEASLVSGHGPVNSHYAVSPYYYDELATPGVHLVLKSNDTLGGPHVNGMLVAAPFFHAGNPTITQAVLAAQQDANAFIKHNAREAAAIYLSLTHDTRRQNDVAGMIADPDIVWTTVPQRLMEFVAFLHKVGRLRHMPASWQHLMLPEGRSGAGS